MLAELPALAVASYRATRLVTDDTIFDQPRDTAIGWLAERRWGRKVAEGLTCPWCAGVWVSAAIYAAWAAGRHRPRRSLVEHAISVLAVAGAQGLLASWEGE